jgi:hypothetical protein
MTPFRIQALESLGFNWAICLIPWNDRLIELADYKKVHGHCNVPHRYSDNSKLGRGSEPKGAITGYIKKEKHRLRPPRVFSNWIEWGGRSSATS